MRLGEGQIPGCKMARGGRRVIQHISVGQYHVGAGSEPEKVDL
jgi:hypothetical protein